MKRLWCVSCYHVIHNWPFDTQNRVSLAGSPRNQDLMSRSAMIDRTPIGDQHVLAGAEQATDATMMQRRANAPLRPTRIQLPIGGLFSDTHTQTDLIDAIRGMK
jgi:hypothetical protein